MISTCHEQIRLIGSTPSTEPSAESLAWTVFDPYTARRLNTFVPLQIVTLPTTARSYELLSSLLTGWTELARLVPKSHLSDWEIAGNLALWLPRRELMLPYMRSSTITTFGHKSYPAYILDRFFQETLQITYKSITEGFKSVWVGDQDLNVYIQSFEKYLIETLQDHIKCLWLNPPRRRRHLMRSTLNWHILYDLTARLLDEMDLTRRQFEGKDRTRRCIALLPTAILSRRLSVIREIVLSGFQLELYAAAERSFAYWYSGQVIVQHLHCLDELLKVVEEGSGLYNETIFQQSLLTALNSITTGLFWITVLQAPFEWSRARQSFFKRYKWAYRPEYDDIETPVVALPEVHTFLAHASRVRNAEKFDAEDSFMLANVILEDLIKSNNYGLCSDEWEDGRLQLLRNLSDVSLDLSRNVPRGANKQQLKNLVLKWDPARHPWFPFVQI